MYYFVGIFFVCFVVAIGTFCRSVYLFESMSKSPEQWQRATVVSFLVIVLWLSFSTVFTIIFSARVWNGY